MSLNNSSTDQAHSFHEGHRHFDREHWRLFGIEIAVHPCEAIIIMLLFVSVIAVSSIGNILIIKAVNKFRKLQVGRNFFIMSLAFADLAVIVLVIPFHTIHYVMGKWIFGSFACELWAISTVFCSSASILNMCVIAVDRYWSAIDPIGYRCNRSLTHVKIMIGFTWIMSAIISSPPLYIHDWAIVRHGQQCVLTNQIGFIMYTAFGTFYIPLIIMIILYWKIYLIIRQQWSKRPGMNTKKEMKHKLEQLERSSSEWDSVRSEKDNLRCGREQGEEKIESTPSSPMPMRLTRSMSTPLDSESNSEENDTEVLNKNRTTTSMDKSAVNIAPKSSNFVQEVEDRNQRKWEYKERRAAYALGVIMGVFIFCWLPFFVVYVAIPLSHNCIQISPRIFNIITWLGFTNSGLNPIIYYKLNKEFRVAFRKLWRRV